MFSLTKEAIDYLRENIKVKNEKPVIIIYQISKQACAGSYSDYFLELNFKEEKIDPSSYEKYGEVDDGYGIIVPIYIEKRILSDFPEKAEILIDIQITKKFHEEYVSLILKEQKR
ncbi:MAG: hypothetical protein ACFFHV_02235 [Promethearchaeota archaeon]